MPIIGNKQRWKTHGQKSYGNTVTWAKNKLGSETISAIGREAQVTREILRPEDHIKLIGKTPTNIRFGNSKHNRVSPPHPEGKSGIGDSHDF